MTLEFDLPADARILMTGASGYLGQALLKSLRHLAPPGWRWVLTDVQAEPTDTDLPQARWVVGDLSSADVMQAVFAEPLDAVVHLAGLMSGRTEQDVALGEQINLQAALALMARCREQFRAGGRPVRWVMSSSIAVYGVPLPLRLDDRTPCQPTLSYGTHKRMLELMLDDMCRRGDLDGRAVRLSGIVVRPRLPNGALSGFNSDLLREPLQGQHYTCPVGPEASIWLLSLDAAVEHVLRLLAMPWADWRKVMGPGEGCALNAPAWPARVAELVQAMAALDSTVPSRIHYAPEAPLQAQFGSWPLNVSFDRAQKLRLRDERVAFNHNLNEFVRQLAVPATS